MKKIYKNIQKNRGMTYVELIVVLGIFGIMSAIVMFNYGEFQARVDIKNLANDVALKIVEAQKSAVSGRLSVNPLFLFTKPSYGVYFYPTYDPKSFIYFADSDASHFYTNPNITGSAFCGENGEEANTGFECLDKIDIGKGNYISSINTYIGSTLQSNITDPLAITFTRPDPGAIFVKGIDNEDNPPLPIIGFDYVQITVASGNHLDITADIKIYPSGRIQID